MQLFTFQCKMVWMIEFLLLFECMQSKVWCFIGKRTLWQENCRLCLDVHIWCTLSSGISVLLFSSLDFATVDHKQDLDMFFILSGDFSSAIFPVSILGSFVSFHDRLCLEPRVSKCTNQHLWCRIIEGTINFHFLCFIISSSHKKFVV